MRDRPERDEDLGRGIIPERDEEDDRKAGADMGGVAAEHLRAVLADLDRRWRVPPTAFCRELAVQVVAALADDPALLEKLAQAVARAVLLVLAQAGTDAGET